MGKAGEQRKGRKTFFFATKDDSPSPINLLGGGVGGKEGEKAVWQVPSGGRKDVEEGEEGG